MADSGSFKIEGAKELQELLKTFPDKVKQRATDTAVRQAGARLRTAFRRAAPRKSGTLRSSIGTGFDKRTGKVYVGLQTRYYYKSLEYSSKRGAPLNPFFEQAWKQNREQVAQLIINYTHRALYLEAGKIHARTIAKKVR